MAKITVLFLGSLMSMSLLLGHGIGNVSAQQTSLTSDFYEESCPLLPTIVHSVVKQAIQNEPRMGASLLRLHFHDCWVQGCDASILLDDTATVIGEKSAAPNNNSVRGYDVIDAIKAELESACPHTVSCADIVALAARDAVAILHGPRWDVELGRRDSLTPASQAATLSLPPPVFNLSQLISNFAQQNMSVTDMVALSGAHTIGKAACKKYRAHIYNETNIDLKFAQDQRRDCPFSGGDDNLSDLDFTTKKFDSRYFKDLVKFQGLLHSDQELFNDQGGATDSIVTAYARSQKTFFRDFASAMVKMGRLNTLIAPNGEIREDCRKAN